MNKFLVHSIILLLLDRLAKVLALKQILTLPGFTLFLNDGIVFSILPSTSVNIIFSVLILFLVAYSLVAHNNLSGKIQLALILIFIGGCSNLFDRFTYGAVVDYLSFGLQGAFNLADVYVLLGVCILIYHSWRHQPRRFDKN